MAVPEVNLVIMSTKMARGLPLMLPAVLLFVAGGGAQQYSRGFYGVDRTFSARLSYDPLVFSGSVLGLLDRDPAPFALEGAVGRRTWSRDGEPYTSVTSATLPQFSAGSPGVICMQARFSPWKTVADPFTVHLKRFGVTMAGGLPQGVFRMGVSLQGVAGGVEHRASADRRVVMGADTVALYLGSRLHPLVGVGAHIAVDGVFDSLYRTVYVEDRYFEGVLPRIGGDVSIGDSTSRVTVSAAVAVARRRFIYFTAPAAQRIHPVMRDSLSWRIQGIGDAVQTTNVTLSPAMHVGYRRTNVQIHDTIGGNNDPFDFGAPFAGESWKVAAVALGLGLGVDYREFLQGWIEYGYSHVGLTYGVVWTQRPPFSPHHHRSAAGLSLGIHRTPWLSVPHWLEAVLHVSFMNMRDYSGHEPYGSTDVRYLDAFSANSQAARYTPAAQAQSLGRLYRTTVALDAVFAGGILEAGGYLASFRRRDTRGLEAGARLGLTLRRG